MATTPCLLHWEEHGSLFSELFLGYHTFCSLCPLSFISPFFQMAHDALFIEGLSCKMQEDTMSNDV